MQRVSLRSAEISTASSFSVPWTTGSLQLFPFTFSSTLLSIKQSHAIALGRKSYLNGEWQATSKRVSGERVALEPCAVPRNCLVGYSGWGGRGWSDLPGLA